jgi:dCTP deaminase
LLVDYEIKKLIEDEQVIYPFEESLINPSSMDIRLSREGWSKLSYPDITGLQGQIINPFDKTTINVNTFETDSYELKPNEFILASSLEKFDVPADCSLELLGKSSLARLGLLVHVTAGWLDPGFNGHLVFELKNLGPYTIRLESGMRIAQVIFHKHNRPLETYSEKLGSKYVNQEPGQGSLYWINNK